MSSRLADLPKIRELTEQLQTLQRFVEAAQTPILGSVLKVMGAEVDKIVAMREQVEGMKKKITEYETMPDRFNDIFAERGFIVHELMSFEVVKAAVEKAESHDADSAEDLLVNYYDPEMVEQLLIHFTQIKAFNIRRRLIFKALEDYREERYHACVPVMLSMLDGLVHDVHESRQGPFSRQYEDAGIEAYNSLSAHNAGFGKLVGILRKGQWKTTDEERTLPFRNGIMHGLDLGYDNRVVAAKTWAAFIAIYDYAYKAEQGQLDMPPQKPAATWKDLQQHRQEMQNFKKGLNEWEARTLIVGQDIPITGDPEHYYEGTPERKLVEFLSLWRKKNYGLMAQCLQKRSWDPKTSIEQIKQRWSDKKFENFSLKSVLDQGAAFTEVYVSVAYEEQGDRVCVPMLFRLICEDDNGKVSIRNSGEGRWYIVNWQVLDV